MIKLRPINDRVIVDQHDADEKSDGGIVIANNKDKPLKGTVIAAGPGYWLGEEFVPTQVKAGDVVLFGKSAGEEVEVEDDVTYLVLREGEILATLDE